MRRPAEHHKRARRGITLFEAVAAMTIVGVTSIAALASVGAEFRTAERARRALETEALATSRLDAIELLTDRELQALPDSVASGVFPDSLSQYAWKTTSEPVDEEPGVYAIGVSITWKNGSYDVHSYAYRRPPIITGNR